MSGNAQIANLTIAPNQNVEINNIKEDFLGVLIYEGELEQNLKQGDFVIIDTQKEINLISGEKGVKALLFKENCIQENIIQYGPFVMNSVKEIQDTLLDIKNNTFIKEKL